MGATMSAIPQEPVPQGQELTARMILASEPLTPESTLPDYIQKYTNKTIPSDMTEDEIDEWLAIIPDLLDYWERTVAVAKLDCDMLEHHTKLACSLAYNNTDMALSAKSREQLAAFDPEAKRLTVEGIQLKYKLLLAQSVYNKMESKSKSLHKIATMRCRRIEAGVVPTSIKSSQPYQQPQRPPNPPAAPKADKQGIVWEKQEKKNNPPAESTQKPSNNVTTVKPSNVGRVDGTDRLKAEINGEMSRELNDELMGSSGKSTRNYF